MTKRIHLIDELRGLAIIFMIIFHFIYQAVIFYSLSSTILHHPLIRFFQLSAQLLFITISGISCSFSKNNLKRGSLCLFYGLLITTITYLFVPSEAIFFGILHFLGCSMLLYVPCKKLLKKMKPAYGALLFFICFLLSYPVIYKELFFDKLQGLAPVGYLWRNGFLTLLGMPSPSFSSSDYFPFVPWLFLFIGGTYIGNFLSHSSHDFSTPQPKVRFLSFIGRHSLMIYLGHIPIILGILFLLNEL